MRKIIKILTSKTLILGLFILAQLFFLGFVVSRLIKDEYIGIYLNWFFAIILIFIVIHVVSSDMNPEYKIAWIIPILAYLSLEHSFIFYTIKIMLQKRH